MWTLVEAFYKLNHYFLSHNFHKVGQGSFSKTEAIFAHTVLLCSLLMMKGGELVIDSNSWQHEAALDNTFPVLHNVAVSAFHRKSRLFSKSTGVHCPCKSVSSAYGLSNTAYFHNVADKTKSILAVTIIFPDKLACALSGSLRQVRLQ